MSTSLESYVIFELAGSVYGLPSQSVLHIEMFEHVTLVPNANPAIEGVVFSRGQVIPALNLRVRFGLPRAEKTLRTRILFTQIHDRTVGLIVDSAREFRNFSTDHVRPLEQSITGINRKYVVGMIQSGERLVLVPDLNAILNIEDVQLPPQPESKPAPRATSKK